jgi:hypothetical protein
MALWDQMNELNPKVALAPAAAVVDNTAQVCNIIDIAGYESLTYLIITGVEADVDATFTVSIQEGDAANLSDAATVASTDLIGTTALASFLFSDDNKCFKLGYKGTKRYTRLTITPAANAGNLFVAVIALLGKPHNAPTANPPN